jgi:hypothetical protein
MKSVKGAAMKAKVAVLDEIIGMCDKSAADPFRKQKAEAPESDAPVAETKEEKPDLEDMDLSELLEMYEGIKGKKKDADEDDE